MSFKYFADDLLASRYCKCESEFFYDPLRFILCCTACSYSRKKSPGRFARNNHGTTIGTTMEQPWNNHRGLGTTIGTTMEQPWKNHQGLGFRAGSKYQQALTPNRLCLEARRQASKEATHHLRWRREDLRRQIRCGNMLCRRHLR